MKYNFTLARNPLVRNDFRNLPCICGSGAKVKKCCGVQYYIPSRLAEAFGHFIKGDTDKAKEVAAEYLADKKRQEEAFNEANSNLP